MTCTIECYGPMGCYKPKCVAMPLTEMLWSAMGQNQVLLIENMDIEVGYGGKDWNERDLGSDYLIYKYVPLYSSTCIRVLHSTWFEIHSSTIWAFIWTWFEIQQILAWLREVQNSALTLYHPNQNAKPSCLRLHGYKLDSNSSLSHK